MKVFGTVEPGVTYIDRPGAYGFLLNSSGELAVVELSLGYFLPGGGVDPGESLLDGLKRELIEELAFEVTRADLVCEAVQYHRSDFYHQDFKKIGSFYRIEGHARPGVVPHPQHQLVWWSRARAEHHLTQEFQRWAVTQLP